MLPDSSALVLFMLAALVLLIVPGPAVLYIVARSIDQGRRAGIVSVLGIGLGSLVHVTAAALGLSALLMSSALAFSLVKYLGAVYLIYLGIRKLREKPAAMAAAAVQPQPLGRIFRQGIVVNVLNPKTALFFFAFLPQFTNPAKGSVTLQILLLGLIFTLMGITSDSLYAMAAGTAGNWLKGNAAFLRGQHYFAGSIYLLLGLVTAVSGSSHQKTA